jgi:cyclophilin family peptidyl-prolyl cis-trans isomerase
MSKADRRARKRDNKQMGRAEREAELKRRKRRSGLIRGVVAVVVIVGGIALILNLAGDDKKETAATTVATVAPTTPTTPVALPASCVATKPPAAKPKTYTKAPPMTIDLKKKYTATMTTTCGDITIALDAVAAPKTVNSFVFLAKEGYYDGLTFHRVAKDFVVQGGDPKGDGTGDPGYKLPTEAPSGGYKAGSIAMANSGADTTGSQFFITWTDAGAAQLGGPPYLYSILGQVTKGLDVVKTLGSLYNRDQNPADPSSQRTALPLYIFKVTISES